MTFLYLNSDQMGAGDPDLGRRLLEIFLAKLAASEVQIDAVGCVNGGVHLTTRPGPALDCLRELEAQGAKITSCGTCLEHFGLTDRLLVGSVGSMVDTITLLGSAARVIRP